MLYVHFSCAVTNGEFTKSGHKTRNCTSASLLKYLNEINLIVDAG